MDEMGRVLEKSSSLPKGLQYECDITLLKIANATVYKFRASAGRPLREIALLEQQRPVSSRSSVDGGTKPRRTTTYDGYVPRPVFASNPLEEDIAFHRRGI
jgi:hypothetical protein